jgi:type II secretory pathway component PulM
MVVLGGGSPMSMLVRGIVIIAILAFTYLVIIKPIMSSTNDAVDNAFHQAGQLQHQVNHTINKSLQQANQAEKQATK